MLQEGHWMLNEFIYKMTPIQRDNQDALRWSFLPPQNSFQRFLRCSNNLFLHFSKLKKLSSMLDLT